MNLTALACLLTLSPMPAGAQTLDGLVFGGSAGSILTGATVRLLDERFATVDSTSTNAMGRFEFAVRSPGTYWVSAEITGYATALSEPLAIGEDGGTRTVMLSLSRVGVAVTVAETDVAEDRRGGSLVGRVVDRSTADPVEGAEISLLPGPIRVLSDQNGNFRVTDVAPGVYELKAEHIAYATLAQDLLVAPGGIYQIRVKLDSEAVPIEGLTVTTRSRPWFKRMEDVAFRMKLDLGGIFITEEQLERRGRPKVSRALRGLPGVKVREGPMAAAVFFRRCRSRPPLLWIDGIRIAEGGWDINMVAPNDIETIEIYRSPSSVPAEFAGPGSDCGALVIWTKRGG
jgi:Carboxypeptidase regulatory-like domain/TonB-dependent Receptor Plug Domain